MSLRPSLVHACFSQNLGEPRPAKCSCKYRVTTEQAKKMVEDGLASWLIVDWKKDGQGNSVAVTSINLVWGSSQASDAEGTVRSALAMKTPRVMTIEKSNIERSYVCGDSKRELQVAAEESARIEAYGEMSREVISNMTVEIPANFVDHFEGRAILTLIGLDQRTCPGKDKISA